MNWASTRLDAIASIQTGPFGSQLHQEDYVEVGTPIITVEHLGGYRITRENLPMVSEDDVERLRKYSLLPGDVVFSRVGSVDQSSFVTRDEEGWLFSGRCLRIRPHTNEVNPLFLYYSLNTREVKNFIRAIAVGATMPSINTAILSEVQIPSPPIAQQQRISSIVGALDDKIAANLTTVQKTNALAIALVGMRSQDASQTPLRELTSRISRGIAPKYDDSGKYIVLNQKCIRDSQVDIARARLMKSLPKSPGKVLRQNDVLVNSTGQGTLGRIARWTSSDPNTSVDTHVSIVRFDPDVSDPAFAGTVLSTMERLVEDLAEGSTGQTELKRDLLGSLELSLPPLDVQREVGQQIELLDELCRTRIEENSVLAKTRDELLPLLMSGMITVKEAEQEATSAGVDIAGEESEA